MLLDLKGDNATNVRPARNADGRGLWAKDPSSPTADDGTRLDATFINDLIGLFRGLCTAYDITPTAGDDTIIAQALAIAASAAISLKSDISSPVFTGNPKAPTPPFGDNSQSISTTEFVQSAIADLVASSPEALDTLNELAVALGNDPNFSTTITNLIAGKLAKASNLSDLENASTGLSNLGLSANGKSLVTAANYAAMLGLLGAQAALGYTPVNRAGDVMAGRLDTVGLTYGKAVDVSSTNLNNLTTAGFYNGSVLTNSPDGSSNWFHIEVLRHSNLVSVYVVQKAYSLASSNLEYIRYNLNGTWSSWVQRISTAVLPIDAGTFTPSLSFGGGATGLAYSSRSGSYIKIGKNVLVDLNIALSNKGSSAGSATIGGLPFASITDAGSMLSSYSNLSGVTGNVYAWAVAPALSLRCGGAAAFTSLFDTNFTNTAQLFLAGSYRTAT